MYEYLQGEIKELNPTYLVLEISGIGYFIHISVNTYAKLNEKKKLFGLYTPGNPRRCSSAIWFC
ncbi:MAG: hypothetical protein MZV63_19150 [Marinilabiliales bacterium]|nr:hypothetical protein [Marinilabiliales bacterium]